MENVYSHISTGPLKYYIKNLNFIWKSKYVSCNLVKRWLLLATMYYQSLQRTCLSAWNYEFYAKMERNVEALFDRLYTSMTSDWVWVFKQMMKPKINEQNFSSQIFGQLLLFLSQLVGRPWLHLSCLFPVSRNFIYQRPSESGILRLL